jgi:hypothetical protein
LNIVGDSKNTIRYCVAGSEMKDLGLKSLIGRIRIILNLFSFHFFHVLRENNLQANEMDNKAIGLAPLSLWINGDVNYPPSIMFASSLDGGTHRGIMGLVNSCGGERRDVKTLKVGEGHIILTF